ncbi:hypothetical protein [Crocinitomix catalasitica]|uniref:hypothetical protein n=1 Tax=Crocinitomix catalasitica TaxID=184607 RepID=UPI000483A5A6|nr:hypothetical protein [Crocinitomix catalasitica]
MEIKTRFGTGHEFTVNREEILIKQKGLFSTKLVRTIPLNDFIKIEFIQPFDQKNRFKTIFAFLINFILIFTSYHFDVLSKNYVLIEYKVEDEIAKSSYYSNFKKGEFEQLSDLLNDQLNTI